MPDRAVPALPLAPAPGRMNVDFEERVDFARLRRYRLERAKQAMEDAGLGALLVFDNNNIRYLTGVAIGEWTRDKLCRYALYTRTGELVLWDFGSAAVHHRLYCPWLKPENCIASYTTMRGAAPPASGLTPKQVTEIKDRLQQAGIVNEPVGVDFAEVPTFFELGKQHIDIRDGQQVMLDARQLKSKDEVALLSSAAAMVDGTYADIAEALRPGVRENEIVALANKRLYEMGSDDVESVNAVSGERCNPHPHNFSDRMIRPGEQAFFDIMHSYNGYRTCYYRCFAVGRASQPQLDAYKKAREWIDAAATPPRQRAECLRRTFELMTEHSESLARLMVAENRSKVAELVASAAADGGTVVTGGRAPDRKGFFYQPTVIDQVPSGAVILGTEIFGPVAPVVRFTAEDEAVRWANDTEFGLVSYVYTQDLSRGLRVSEALEAGMVGLNRGIVSDPAAPFGGVKQSGIGREGAHDGLLEFTETKYIATNW